MADKTSTFTEDAGGTAPWIVVPAFNESSRIAKTLRGLLSCGRYSIVVVDDGSRDETVDVVSRFPVWLLKHSVNCGQGAALRTGIEFALLKGAQSIVTFDADDQHDPADVEALIAPLRDAAVDVVLGSRFLGHTSGMPTSRRALLKAATFITRWTTGLQLTDVHNGLRAFSRRAAQTISIRQPRMAHASEILDQVARHRLSYVEIPVTVRYTDSTLEKGQSSFDAARIGGDLVLGRFIKS